MFFEKVVHHENTTKSSDSVMRVLIIVALLLAGQKIAAQNASLTYSNFGAPIVFGKDTLHSSRIHEIILNPDSTFDFWSRPHVSCFTWNHYTGAWKREKDTLIFIDIKFGAAPNITVYGTVKSILQNNKIVIISGRTSSLLPGYKKRLEFEDGYNLDQ